MLDALDILEELEQIYGIEIEVEETVIYGYIAIRLKPLLGKHGISKEKINKMCEHIAQNYFDRNVSIDYSVNAVYNYINFNKKSPSDNLFTTNLTEFLDDYAEEDYDD
jgi:hypothetical protein